MTIREHIACLLAVDTGHRLAPPSHVSTRSSRGVKHGLELEKSKAFSSFFNHPTSSPSPSFHHSPPASPCRCLQIRHRHCSSAQLLLFVAPQSQLLELLSMPRIVQSHRAPSSPSRRSPAPPYVPPSWATHAGASSHLLISCFTFTLTP